MANEIMQKRFAEIERLAYAMGLRPFDVVFQEAPTATICEVASYGLPTRYSHWSHGRSLQYQKSQQEMGSSKIYELILNSNPSLAFLDNSNTDTANLMICAHCLGHSDVFKNNIMFKMVNEPNMVQTAKQHALRIDEYRNDYGDDEVDDWIDIAHSLANNIDPFRGYNRKRYDVRHVAYKERKPTAFEDIVYTDRQPLIEKTFKNVHIPPTPEKDLLWFLAEYSNIEPWQKDVFEIVRRESYYFYAQFRTKILNEGWASMMHLELMNQYFLGNKNDYGVTDIEYRLTEEEHLDFLTLHEKVVRPGFKHHLKHEVPEYKNHVPTGRYVKVWDPNVINYPGRFRAIIQINPYYVGFRVFRDIKERWDKYYEQGYMEDHLGRKEPVTINGNQKMRQVMEEEDDVSFLRNYLTEELVDDLHLFTYGNDEGYDDNYEYQEEWSRDTVRSMSDQEVTNKTVAVKSKKLEDIIHAFERMKSNYGVPAIAVRRVDATGLLRLEHLPHDKTNLDIKSAEEVLKYIYKVWNRNVELIRKEGERTWQMCYDGDAFVIDYQTSEYPENVENAEGPSTW